MNDFTNQMGSMGFEDTELKRTDEPGLITRNLEMLQKELEESKALLKMVERKVAPLMAGTDARVGETPTSPEPILSNFATELNKARRSIGQINDALRNMRDNIQL